MKKKFNNRGFALTEVLITSVIVLSIFAMLFNIIYPLLGSNSATNKYEDIDTKYIAFYVKSFIETDVSFSNPSLNQSVCGYTCKIYETRTKKCQLNGTECATDGYGDIIYVPVDNVFSTSDHYVNNNDLCDQLDDSRFGKNNRYLCNKYIHDAKITRIIITNYDTRSFKNAVNDNNYFSRSLREYVKYMPTHADASSSKKSTYNLLIVEVEHDSYNTYGDKYYTYASIEVRK